MRPRLVSAHTAANSAPRGVSSPASDAVIVSARASTASALGARAAHSLRAPRPWKRDSTSKAPAASQLMSGGLLR